MVLLLETTIALVKDNTVFASRQFDMRILVKEVRGGKDQGTYPSESFGEGHP